MNSISSGTSASLAMASQAPTKQRATQDHGSTSDPLGRLYVEKILATSSPESTPAARYMTPPTHEGHLAVKTLSLLLLQRDLQPLLGRSGWQLRAANTTLNQAFFVGEIPSKKKMLSLFGELSGLSKAQTEAFIQHGTEANKTFYPTEQNEGLHPVIYEKTAIAITRFGKMLNSPLKLLQSSKSNSTQTGSSFSLPILPAFSADMFPDNRGVAEGKPPIFQSIESSMSEMLLLADYTSRLTQATTFATPWQATAHPSTGLFQMSDPKPWWQQFH